MQKQKALNVFEVRPIRRDFTYKISSADVFNEFLYIGDEKGNVYSYPIKVHFSQGRQMIPTSSHALPTKLLKTLLNRKSINQSAMGQQGPFFSSPKINCLLSIQLCVRQTKSLSKFKTSQSMRQEQSRDKPIPWSQSPKKKKESFSTSVLLRRSSWRDVVFKLGKFPPILATRAASSYCHIKRIINHFLLIKILRQKKVHIICYIGNIQAKLPYLKVINGNEVIIFMDDIGLFMDGEFNPKQKDNIVISRPIQSIKLCGGYGLVLCENQLQIYSTFAAKRFNAVQQVPLNGIRGVTSERPFVYGRDELYFLFQIPYEIQIKALLERARVEQAINLLIQNEGENTVKLESLKMDAVWFLLKKMQFDKCKELVKGTNFDIREIVLLYPELISLDIQSIRNSKAEKYMSTMIVEAISERGGPDAELKRRSKLFLKQILEFRRQQYASRNAFNAKLKVTFPTSKYSLVKTKLPPASSEEMLQIIDFCLIKWFIEANMFEVLKQFFQNNPVIYCKKMYQEIEILFRNNQKVGDSPTLRPRFLAAFDKLQQAFECWKNVSEGKDNLVDIACSECVGLLLRFEDKSEMFKKLMWIINRKPEIGMNFFKQVDLNFLQPDEVIRYFEQQKNTRYLQLYLQTIVFEKKTQIQAYHTKLLLLYLDNLFECNARDNKEEGKTAQFAQRLARMRRLLKSTDAKYASEPALKKIDRCQWLLEDQIYLYSREKRHKEALQKYINKNMYAEAEAYCKVNHCLTLYFNILLNMYKSYETSKNKSEVLLKRDIVLFLKKYANDPQLDAITVLQSIPGTWMLNDTDSIGGVYQFLESAVIQTLHEKRCTQTSKYLSEMDLLNVESNLIQAKKASIRFTYKKKCCICHTAISDSCFLVYPNANVCHQACVKKESYSICPITKQDFQKTFKY